MTSTSEQSIRSYSVVVVPPETPVYPHLSYDLVRSKREYCKNCSLVVVLCSILLISESFE